MSSAIQAAAEAIQQSVGTWEPGSAVELDGFLADLPQLLEAVAGSIGSVAGRLGSDFPVHPSVVEHLADIASTVAGMSDFAAEAHSVHRAAHAKEMERIEEPRPNEELWDVSRNG